MLAGTVAATIDLSRWSSAAPTARCSVDTDERGGWFSFRHHGSVEFDVTVPERARVEITAVSADIASQGLLGDQSYRTVSGDVVVDGVAVESPP